MKNTLLLFFCITFLFANDSFGQDRKKFVKQFTSIVSSSQATSEANSFIKDKLSPMLLEGTDFPENRFLQMATTVDLIIEKRHSVFPDAYNYVVSVYSLVKMKKTGKNFDVWHEIVDQLLEMRNPKRIEEFLASSSNFLEKGIIGEDINFKWFCSGEDFEFVNDKSTAFIKFGNTNLICKTINRGSDKKENPYSDSIKITNTKGTADINKGKWEGTGGGYTWEKVGLPAKETHATLSSYTVSFKSTTLTADSVILNTPYINEPVMGRLMDRAIKGASREGNEVPFPKFNSYKANFEIKNLVDGVDYRGGFSMVADEFEGTGNENQQAKLTYYRDGEVFVVTYSDYVHVNKTNLKTPLSQMSLYLNTGDSITHTSLDVTYDITNQIIRFERGNSAITAAPFVDSYHRLNIYPNEISWKRNSSELTLGYNRTTSKQQRKARFESFNFYDARLFSQLQGGSSIHPLTALYQYAYKYDEFRMTEGKAASALQSTVEQVKPLLLELSALGFISYDTERGTVTVNDKTENFVKANSGKVDYDNLSFVSDLAPINIDNSDQDSKKGIELEEKIRKRNQERDLITEFGRIDLATLDMQINAVDLISISDRKRTTIFPEGNKVVIKENRNIDFNGWINSGRWEVKINEGNYNYEDNKFNIKQSEMAFFHVKPIQDKDGKQFIPLQSDITGIKGELLVDDVNNRSGLNKNFEKYPILSSKGKTKVFYDQKDLFLGAYKKDEFYFELEPFEVDSLSTFNDEKLKFPGELVSAGIFPKFHDALKVMPDYSLGFSQEAPSTGYQFYNTDAKYKNKILLSNNGLQGAGTINFLNSTSTSKGLFTFLPDSTTGVASFVNKPQIAGVEFPDADGPDVYITYLPKAKKLKAQSNAELITFFGGEANLSGMTVVEEKGMTGKGILALPEAKMLSQGFRFSRWHARADTSNFQLTNKYGDKKEVDENPFAFTSENVKGDLDFKDRKGVFISNQGESLVTFPVNQYVCKIDQFTWIMDSDEMSLEKKGLEDISISGDLDLAGSNFFSINPDQDSLQFRSPKAKFDLREKVIYSTGVDYIRVADALIYPDSGNVVIRKKAKMDPLTDSRIVANSVSKIHTITNVDAQITGRKAYTASGDYEYGIEGGTKQLIHFEAIRLDTSYQTVATGTIEKSQDFTLGDQFSFNGQAHLKASETFLYFTGATRLIHDCDKFSRNWMAFKSSIDPEHIQIPISKDMVDLEGNKLSVGIRWRNSNNTDSVSLYPTFLSAVDYDDDPIVISADGFLQFDKGTSEFQIASKEKLTNRNEKGNYISLHTNSCSMHGDGEISLGMDYGTLETKAVGVVDYNQATEQTNMNITLAIRAPLYEKSFESIGEKIVGIEGLQDADFTSTTLEQALVDWTDVKTADKIKSDFTLKKKLSSVPKEMRDAIVITGLRLTSYTKSGDSQRGLKSSVAQAVLVNMYKQPVMKYVPLQLFAEQRANLGDRLGILMDIPGGYLYFFDYDNRKEGVMNILSNDEVFTEEIIALKPAQKKGKRFIYDITSKSVYKSLFLRVFE